MATSAAIFSPFCYLQATKRSPRCHSGGNRQTAEMAVPGFRTYTLCFEMNDIFMLDCSHAQPTEVNLTPPPAALFHFVNHERFTKAQST